MIHGSLKTHALFLGLFFALSAGAEHAESGAPRAPAARPQAPAAGKPALIYLSSFKSKDAPGIVESGRRETSPQTHLFL